MFSPLCSVKKSGKLIHALLKAFGHYVYAMFLVLWEKDGITVGELCKRLMLDTGTVTPMLKNTEKQGLIKRTRSEEDERVVVISLTEEGKALYKKARQIPEKIGSCVKLDKSEAVALYKILYKLLEE